MLGAENVKSTAKLSSDLRDDVTFIFTTLERNEAAKRLIDSVRHYFPDLPIIVADQNHPNDAMRDYYSQNRVDVIWVPYDCGLSYARNRAVQTVSTPFVLIGDDDFIFTDMTDITAALSILCGDDNLGVVGGSIIDVYHDNKGIEYRALRRFECFLIHLDKWRTLVTIPIDYLAPQDRCIAGHTIYLCEMTLNWALFRTDLFVQGLGWDETIKINGEHEDFFLALKKKGAWEVAYFPGLQCEHSNITSPSYGGLRNRSSGRQAMAKKWGLDYHLQIGTGLRDFRRYHDIEDTQTNRSDLYSWDGLGASDHGHMPPKKYSYVRLWEDGHATAYEGAIDFADSKARRVMEDTKSELEARDRQIDMSTRQIDMLTRQIDMLNRQIDMFKMSLSWRITRPLRAMKSLFLFMVSTVTRSRTQT